MKHLLLLLGLLYAIGASAQFEVGIGYNGNGEYGKAYLEAGSDKLGGAFTFGGDSKITYGGYTEGKGYVGGSLWYKIVSGDAFFIKLRVGGEAAANYVAHDDRTDTFINPNEGRAEYVDSSFNPLIGVSFGYKFVQLNINYVNGLEAGIGFILKR